MGRRPTTCVPATCVRDRAELRESARGHRGTGVIAGGRAGGGTGQPLRVLSAEMGPPGAPLYRLRERRPPRSPRLRSGPLAKETPRDAGMSYYLLGLTLRPPPPIVPTVSLWHPREWFSEGYMCRKSRKSVSLEAVSCSDGPPPRSSSRKSCRKSAVSLGRKRPVRCSRPPYTTGYRDHQTYGLTALTAPVRNPPGEWFSVVRHLRDDAPTRP